MERAFAGQGEKSSLSRYTETCEKLGKPGKEAEFSRAGVKPYEIDSITWEEVESVCRKDEATL